MTRRERLALGAFALVSLALRAAAFFRYRFDSDEPQHLHVAWGWTAGLLQYRDLFDNHAPLFHILTAPILKALGERADVLLYMRAPMLPLFAFVVWATYALGARLASPRVGAWGAVVLSLFPPFFLKSLEYRTDNLWNALWMLVLIVMTGGALTTSRLLAIGFILGVALSVSLKTTLLVVTLGAAGLITYLFVLGGRSLARIVAVVLPVIAGAAIVPAIIVLYFRARGALPDLIYCVFRFNQRLVDTAAPMQIWWPRIIFVPLMAMVLVAAWQRRRAPVWPYFFAVAFAVFALTLGAFWILISPRDLLPIMPLAAIFIASRRPAAAALVCAACIPFLVAYTHGFRNETREHITMMNQVLRMTRPGESLIDYKGETIYRPRPYYNILEFISRRQLTAGLIHDTIARDVVRARCHAAQADGDFWPPDGRAFLRANFLDMGRIRAAGQFIKPDGTFTIAVPGPYVVVSRFGRAAGLLDGTPANVRELAAGVHRFEGDDEHHAVVWAPAFERGLSPFHLQDREF